ncbi:hypothetical protein FM103_06020 [Corynebacterium xerosis]|nr:hypothetical protein FM103_06020 [Corynebacterium xerosis]
MTEGTWCRFRTRRPVPRFSTIACQMSGASVRRAQRRRRRLPPRRARSQRSG